jgi:hypothetical protein
MGGKRQEKRANSAKFRAKAGRWQDQRAAATQQGKIPLSRRSPARQMAVQAEFYPVVTP